MNRHDAAALRAGPWRWPTEADATGLADARGFSGLAAPPSLAPGDALLLTVHDGGASVWRLATESTAGLHAATLGPGARAAWRDAEVAVARATPVLLDAAAARAAPPSVVSQLGAVPPPGGCAARPAAVDGASFGLAFALAIASRALGEALPDHVAASAAVDPNGSVGRVDGLAAKAGAVARLTPRVTRLLVSADQPDGEVAACADLGLEVVRVRAVGDALALALPGLPAAVARLGHEPARREALVEALLLLALGDRTALVSWAAVLKTAEAALGGWERLSESEASRLRFTAAIAARHQGQRPPLPALSPRFFARLPPPLRQRAVAHALQASADCGSPSPAEAEALSDAFLRDIAESHAADLMVRGALARLWAVTGRAREALDAQAPLAEAYRARGELAETTYPLSEWFRLAGALGDRGAFEAAAAFEEQVARGPGAVLARPGMVWVARARAAAAAALGDERAADALAEPLVADHLPAHVALGALRVRVAVGRVTEEAARAWLDRSAAPTALKRRYAHLFDLDAALRREDEPAAEAALDALAAHEPEPLGHLLRAFRDHTPASSRPAWVQRLYPY